MNKSAHHTTEARQSDSKAATPFVSLDRETRLAVDTGTAAHHLSRRPNTLRTWACKEDGPLRPLRVNGRLSWSVAELRRVLGVTQ